MFSKKKITIYLLGLISLGLLFIIPSQTKADMGIYDFFNYNWQKGLGYFNTGVSQWLIGGTATTTSQAKLEIIGGLQSTNSTSTNSLAANIFCINNTSPDCISSWSSAGTNFWNYTTGGITPTSTSNGIIVNASSTFTSSLMADSFRLLDGKKLLLGTGNDGEIFVDASDDLNIKNVNSDDDISFSINDGGTTKIPMFFDSSSARIGIGEATTMHTPLTLLHVKGAHVTGLGLLLLQGSDGNNAYFTVDAADTKNSGLFFKEATNNRWLLDYVGAGDYLRIYDYGLSGGAGVIAYFNDIDGRVKLGGKADSGNAIAQLHVKQAFASGSLYATETIGAEQVDYTMAAWKTRSSSHATFTGRPIILNTDQPQEKTIVGWIAHYVDDTRSTGGFTDAKYYQPVYGEPTDLVDQSLLAAGTITPDSKVVRVVGNGAARTLTSTPTISAGYDTQTLIIQGTSDANTITLQDEFALASSTLELAGSANITLGLGDTIMLTYDLGDLKWYEISRSDN